MTPPLFVPRTVHVAQVTNEVTPTAAYSRSQSGSPVSRDFQRAGRSWRETFAYVKSYDPDHAAWLAAMQYFTSRGKIIWVDHPLLPGSGLGANGLGEENLIRSAAMDAGSGGVANDFSSTGAATFSIDGTYGAQKIAVSAATGTFYVSQAVLRVFAGDEITFSGDVQVGSMSGGAVAYLRIDWMDDTATQISFSQTTFSNTSFARKSLTATAPAGTSYAVVRFQIYCATSGTGNLWARDARVIRASGDPSTWCNPHINGAGQTGNTLTTAGWPVSTIGVVKAGDIFRIGGSGSTEIAAESDEVYRSFKVLDDADSDGSGNATITIDPPVWSGLTIPDGAALRLTKTRLRCMISEPIGMSPSSLVNKFSGISVGYAEAV